jgi:hypothetical protein
VENKRFNINVEFHEGYLHANTERLLLVQILFARLLTIKVMTVV